LPWPRNRATAQFPRLVASAAPSAGLRTSIDRLAVAIELHDVGHLDEAGHHAVRQEEMVGVLVVARADMAEAVDNAQVVEDAVGGGEILDQHRIGGLVA
jgi:hypothetical protein